MARRNKNLIGQIVTEDRATQECDSSAVTSLKSRAGDRKVPGLCLIRRSLVGFSHLLLGTKALNSKGTVPSGTVPLLFEELA